MNIAMHCARTAFLLILIQALHMPDAHSQTRSISVTIADSATRKPLGQCEIRLSAFSNGQAQGISKDTLTSADGSAHFQVTNPGTYELVARMKGYRQRKAYGTFGNNQKSDFIRLKIFLVPMK